MKRSELVLTLLAALIAATLGAKENLRSSPPLAALAPSFFAMDVQAPVRSDRLRKPERTKG